MTKAILISGTRNTGKTTAINNLYDYYTSKEGRKAKVLFKLTERTDISAILEYEVNNEKKLVVLISPGDLKYIIENKKNIIVDELRKLSKVTTDVDYWIFTSRTKGDNYSSAISIATALDHEYTEYPTLDAYYRKSSSRDIKKYNLSKINLINSLFIDNIISSEKL
ncbi:muramidase [Lactococcus cremoris]|uniref:muramidase n=1 Tax=Lactococcus TaxID=1357 RepID=UPI0021A6D855|nr:MULTISPECIES: muramidase [Lactococcus]MCT3125924.1 muramidase [Lactococcus lactis]MDA2880673.1 muramidase [Lactococcus cremoris]MDA2883199.1 muramidase [Lactococcus cremoris]